MRYIFVIATLMCFSCSALKPRTSNNYDIVLLFGSGFRNDSLSLNINGRQIIKNQLLKTDSITGLVKNLSIVAKNGKLLLNSNNHEILNLVMKISNPVNIFVQINQKSKELQVNLKKGKIVIFSVGKSNNIQLFQSNNLVSIY